MILIGCSRNKTDPNKPGWARNQPADGHHPIEVHRANVRHDLGGKPRPRNARLASVLKTAASISDDLHLELQVKVPGFKPSINKIGVAAGFLGWTRRRSSQLQLSRILGFRPSPSG